MRRAGKPGRILRIFTVSGGLTGTGIGPPSASGQWVSRNRLESPAGRPAERLQFEGLDRYGVKMLWFFQKQEARIHYEIRRRSDGEDFELVITREDGRQLVEQFPDVHAVAARSRLLHDSLVATGWRTPGSGR